MRKPLQGLRNVVRFNWPYYAAAATALLVLGLLAGFSTGVVRWISVGLIIVSVSVLSISLIVTVYVYDLTGFYKLEWLDDISVPDGARIVNINAGFDETSELISRRFPNAELIVCDFYDSQRHTEPSIARARKAYPPFEGTRPITASSLPFATGSVDAAFAIMSAHEIRDASEREALFAELHRSMDDDGKLVVVEHVRDAANVFAYTFGAWHFHSRPEWLQNFQNAGFAVTKEKKMTPFVSAFFLNKNGASS